MSTTHAAHGQPGEAGQYEIRLNGHLASRWTAWFDPLTLTRESDGTTLIAGRVVDQAALHGLLRKVRDTGLSLVSVTRIKPDQHRAPTPDPHEFVNPRRSTT